MFIRSFLANPAPCERTAVRQKPIQPLVLSQFVGNCILFIEIGFISRLGRGVLEIGCVWLHENPINGTPARKSTPISNAKRQQQQKQEGQSVCNSLSHDVFGGLAIQRQIYPGQATNANLEGATKIGHPKHPGRARTVHDGGRKSGWATSK